MGKRDGRACGQLIAILAPARATCLGRLAGKRENVQNHLVERFPTLLGRCLFRPEAGIGVHDKFGVARLGVDL